MARSYDSMRLRTQRAFDRRLTAEHRQLARQLAALVLRAATARSETGDPIIPPTRAARDALKAAMWEQIRRYYVGNGTDALDGPNPRSPYALLLVEGITEATRIQAERQAALVRRLVRDEEVVRWLTGPRPVGVREMHIRELLTPSQATLAGLRGADGRIDVQRATDALVRPRGTYAPFHEWVDPNGYRLSDRIWRTSIDVRSRVDRLLDVEIARGTSAVRMADLLEPFLTPGALQGRTQTPYGTEGSYAARRLARTEITAAAGRATINASTANPFVNGVQWRTSSSHRDLDECDMNAHGGPNGDGIYPPDQVPRYPNHPQCLCSLLPVPSGDVASLVEELRADIRAARGNLIDAVGQGNPARGRALQGILNPEYLTNAMLTGNLDDAVARAVQQSRTVGRLPVNVRARRPRTTQTTQVEPTIERVPTFGTVKEAEDWARENLSFAGSVRYDGLQVETANAINKHLADRLPQVGHLRKFTDGKLRSILTQESKGDWHMAMNQDTAILSINRKYDTLDKWLDMWDRDTEHQARVGIPFSSKRYLPRERAITITLDHEIGHSVQWSLDDTQKRAWAKAAREAGRSGWVRPTVYAAKDKQEEFAEMFALYVNDRRDLLTSDMNTFFDDLLRQP